jgi:rubrerythrin
MEFSNPFPTNVPRKMNAAELARAIMQDIAAELDAVALYQAHIDATDDERAKKLLAHIRRRERACRRVRGAAGGFRPQTGRIP